MKQGISHDRAEETLEATARWFQALSDAERMESLCMYTDLALSNNPRLADLKDAQPIKGRIRVVSLHDLPK